MTPQEKIFKKLSEDFNLFIEQISAMPPSEIIRNAYETVVKEGILYCFEDVEYLTDAQAEMLLSQDISLDTFYADWLDADIHFETLIKENLDVCISELELEYSQEPAGPQRFMNIDLVDFLGEISKRTITHFPDDWIIDKKSLEKIAQLPIEKDKRLAFHVSSFGSHLLSEQEVFIKDTGAFNCWTQYRPQEPDMYGFFVEITGNAGSKIMGNIFEVGDYMEHTRHVIDTALPLDCVSLTYSKERGKNAGRTITVPRYEYDENRHKLMSESGDVVNIKYHPSESVREMADLLQCERAKRMEMPIGNPKQYLHSLDKKLTEIRDTPTSPAPKQTFEQLLKNAQAKADRINQENAQKQPKIKPHNIEMEEI